MKTGTEIFEALTAMPKVWRVIVRYADGHEKHIDQPLEGSARSCAKRKSQQIGLDLIDRETGKTVRPISVEVVNLAA